MRDAEHEGIGGQGDGEQRGQQGGRGGPPSRVGEQVAALQERTIQLGIENQSRRFALRLNTLDFSRVRYLEDLSGLLVRPGEALHHRVECDAGEDHLPHEATFRVLLSAEPREERADARGIFPLCVLRGRFAYDGEEWSEGRILAEPAPGAPEGVLRLLGGERYLVPGAQRFTYRVIEEVGGASRAGAEARGEGEDVAAPEGGR